MSKKGIDRSKNHYRWKNRFDELTHYMNEPPKEINEFTYWHGCNYSEFIEHLDELEKDTNLKIMRIEAARADTLKLVLDRKVSYLEFCGVKDIFGAEGDSRLGKDDKSVFLWWD